MTIHKKRFIFYIFELFFTFNFFTALQANPIDPENMGPIEINQEINDLFTTTLNQDFEKNTSEILEEKKQASVCENIQPDQNMIAEVLEKIKDCTDESLLKNLILQLAQDPESINHFFNQSFNDQHYDDIAHHITQIIQTDTNPKLKEHIFKQLGHTISTDTQFTDTLVRTHLKDFIAAIIQTNPGAVIQALETVLKNDTEKNTYLSMIRDNLNKLPKDKKTQLFQDFLKENPAVMDTIVAQKIKDGRLSHYPKTTNALVVKVQENTDPTIKNKILPAAEEALVQIQSPGLFTAELVQASKQHYSSKNFESYKNGAIFIGGICATLFFQALLGRHGIFLFSKSESKTQ